MKLWKKRETPRHPLFRPIDYQNIKWFWDNYLRDKTGWLFIVFLMIAGQGLVYQQFLSLTENGLRVIFEEKSLGDLIRVCATVFFLFIARALLSYLTPRLSAQLTGDAVLALRRDLIAHLLRLDLAFFERSKAGDIILRLVNQAEGIGRFVGQTTVNATRDAVTIVIVSGYLIYKAPVLFLTAALVIPTIVIMMQFVSHRIKDIQLKAENALGDYMNGIEEMTNGMRTVKISGQEDRERDRLVFASGGIRDLSVRLQSAQALMMPSIDVVSAFVYMLVIGGGGYMVLNANYDLDAADLITFLLGLVILFDPMRMLANFFAQLQASLILLEGLRSLHLLEPSVKSKPGAIREFDRFADIEFRNVKFHYEDGPPLFEGLNLKIEGGKTTAIVGPTGSGKTTVLSLLTRLYDVHEGDLYLDGKDLRDLDLRSLRHSFSVVAQDIVIFNDSIWENIRYVRPDATDEEIWDAAEKAEIAELIRARGAAPLGPKGSQLSGGQKQRIAIARAFLRSAPIVLLDEATSALDQRTEERVQAALTRLGAEKTTIVVSHRLSSVVSADRIYVLEGGQVVEAGSHQELMESRNLYAAMFDAQKRGYGTSQ